MLPRYAARAAFGLRPRRSLCGGCASPCLLILIFAAVIAVLFWGQINATLRDIYPPWPFALVIPILAYVYSRPSQASPDRQDSPAPATERLTSLLRAHLDVRLGRHTFRLYLFCHGIPDRCFAIRGHVMPICARCTGLVIGFAVGLLIPSIPFLGSIAGTGLASLLIAPLLIDGLTQAAGLRQSTNLLRVVTGAIAGLGVAIGAQLLRLALLGS